MPVPLRTTTNLRAEAKYNVTTEFPNYDLHAAAANGDIGLVKFALAHGQPINSVLDGVLPLHAAAAGGNEQVVTLLIDHGADVNAPRLPRRYSNERNRDASTPIIGNSGATPLHFAAANGHINTIRILLLRGAHPNRADKHGITPESLARGEGWLECADLLKDWILNMDKDLREREGRISANKQGTEEGPSSLTGRPSVDLGERLVSSGNPSTSTRKRLHVKRSIDNAFHLLRGSSSDAHLRAHDSSASSSKGAMKVNTFHTPPASPTKPLGEYTFYPVSPTEEGSSIDPSSRRPSLPHSMSPLPPLPRSVTSSRKFSSSAKQTSSAPNMSIPTPHSPTQSSHHHHRHRDTQHLTSPTPRRPRSAGNGAEREGSSSRNSNRKLGTKYSLMNIFRKGQSQAVEASSGSSAEPSANQETSSSLPGAVLSSISTSVTGSSTNLPASTSPLSQHSLSTSPANSYDLSTTPTSSSPFSRSGFRFRMGSDASNTNAAHLCARMRKISSSRSQSPSQTQFDHSHQSLIPSAVDLHHAMAQQHYSQRQRSQHGQSSVHSRYHSHTRDRSASAGSGTRFDLPPPLSLTLPNDSLPPSIPGDNNTPTAIASSSHNASVMVGSPGSSTSPLARLRSKISQRRDRSGSASSATGARNRNGAVFDDDLIVDVADPLSAGVKSSVGIPVRVPGPGILRGHNRSTSSGLASRALRFNSPSSLGRGVASSPGSGISVGLRGSNSFGSFTRVKSTDTMDSSKEHPDSAPPVVADFDLVDGEEEDDEYAYGRPLDRVQDRKGIVDAVQEHNKMIAPARSRGLSLTSSSESSLSPIDGDDGAVRDGAEGVTTITGEFPFSINHPPPLVLEVETGDVSPPVEGDSQKGRLQVHANVLDGQRARGSSVSSTSTGASSQGALALADPGGNETKEPEVHVEKMDGQAPVQVQVSVGLPSPDKGTNVTLTGKRAHSPLDIDLSTISSHAQAEALVQRAQQDILEMENQVLESGGLSSNGSGWTPLSARLAAYGESLALERRLREQKGKEEATSEPVLDSTKTQEKGRGLESRIDTFMRTDMELKAKGPGAPIDRQGSLEYGVQRRPRPKAKQPKRPHTSTGTSEAGPSNKLLINERFKTHQPSHSASLVDSRPRAVSIDVDIESPTTPMSQPTTLQVPVRNVLQEESETDNSPITTRNYALPPGLQNNDFRSSNSMEAVDTDGESNLEVLIRVGTSPSGTNQALRSRHLDQSRDAARTAKLTKMGFDVAAVRQPPQNKRFGGFKSLMQSFVGKP